LIGVTGADPACSALDLSGPGVTNVLPVAKGGTGTTNPAITAGTNITSVTGVWPNVTINAANQGANNPSYAYHTTTNPVSPVSPTCDANVQNTVYSYSIASSLTVNLSNTSCAAGQNLVFVYKQTAASLAITYTMTTAMMVWQANNQIQPVLSGNGATDWFEFTYDSRSTAFYEVAQAPQIVPAKIYDIAFGFVGIPAASQSDAQTLVRAVNWPANFAGAQVSCGANPTASTTFTINDNGVQIGTLVLTSACASTFTSVGGTAKSGAIDDRITLVAPATPDTTAANISITLAGTLP